MTTFRIDSFKGGRDLRPGQFAGKAKDRFAELTNFYCGKDGKLHRRFPVVQVAGTRDAAALGLIQLNGVYYQILKKGDVPNGTTVDPTVTTLFFNNPDYCTTWTLIQAIVFNGILHATIRHAFPGTTVTSIVRLHVFDSSTSKPTYVEDPWCPTSWAPKLPLHVYRAPALPDVAGAWKDWTPRMALAANKLRITGPDGNTYNSKTNNGRSYNTRTSAEMIDQGEWWYFIKPTGIGPQDFIVSEDWSKLSLDRTWASYVLEYLSPTTSSWVQFVENTSAAVSDGHYYPDTIASRFGGPNEIKLHVQHDGLPADTIYRFRMMVGHSGYIISNGMQISVNPTSVFSGNGVATAFTCPNIIYPPNTTAIVGSPAPILVYVGGVLKATPADYSISYNSSNQAVVTFVAAPAAGSLNVVVLLNAITYQGGSSLYEGQATISEYSQSTPGQVVSKTYLQGYGINLDVTGNLALTPLGLTGYQRYNGVIVQMVTTGSLRQNQAVLQYHYGNETGYESQFYQDKKASYVKFAGFGDAGVLPTMAKNPGGELVIELSAIGDTLLVTYGKITELWQVFADQTLDRWLDNTSVGAGKRASAATVPFYTEVAILSARGIRLFRNTGLNNNNVEDNNIGTPIEDFGGYRLIAGAFWPYTGQLVLALDNGVKTEIHVFDYSKEDKLGAWSKWESVSITRIVENSIIADDNRLYFQVGTTLYYFDASATIFRDAGDVVGAAYLSRARWALLDFRLPGSHKEYRSMDAIAVGAWSMSFQVLTNGDLSTIPGPVSDGTTYGVARVELAMEGQALAPIIESRDETGLRFESLEIDYTLARR